MLHVFLNDMNSCLSYSVVGQLDPGTRSTDSYIGCCEILIYTPAVKCGHVRYLCDRSAHIALLSGSRRLERC
jgi:hypothetical protein